MKELVCIVCPKGCTMEISGEGENITVSGNGCKRGLSFALSEMTEPKRTICSTVKTVFPEVPVLPCRVSADIPKEKIFEVMKAINSVSLVEKIGRGEVIIENVLGLGVDVISTSDILKRI